MAQQARDYWKGIFPPAYDSAGGLDEGDITQITTPASDGTPQAIKPSGTAPWLQFFYGLVGHRGTVGGSGSAAGEAIAVKRQGLGRVKLAISTALTRGAQLIADATTLGTVKPRTPYSSSALVVGSAEESASSSAAVQLVEAYIQPQWVEVVRQVTGQSTGTVTAATRYLTAPGSAVAAAQIPLYCARFDGETIRNLRCWATTAPGGADTGVFTVVKSSDNGATWGDTALTATISAAGKSASDLNSAHAVALVAGDLLAIKIVSSNVTLAGCGATFDVT